MTLVWKEWRDLWPRLAIAVGLLLLALLPFGQMRLGMGLLEAAGLMLAADAISTISGGHAAVILTLLFLFTPWACLLGYDALAGEAADDTWRFLRTRPMRTPAFVAAKLGPRALLLLLPWALYRGAVYALLFWGEPQAAGGRPFTLEQQLDAQYALLSPPYTFFYGEAIVPIHVLASLALAVIVGSWTRNKSMALGGAVLGAAALGILEYRVFWEAWESAAFRWQPPEVAFTVVTLVALALCALACWRTAGRSPLTRPALPDWAPTTGGGATAVLAAVLVVGLIYLIMLVGTGFLLG